MANISIQAITSLQNFSGHTGQCLRWHCGGMTAMAWTLKYLALIKIPELSLLWVLKTLPTKTNPRNHQEVCWPNCSSYGSSKLAGEEKQSLDPLASHGQSRSGMSHLQFMGHLTPRWQVYQMSRQDPHYEGAVSMLACSGPLELSLPSQPRPAPSLLLLRRAPGSSCPTSPGRANLSGPHWGCFLKRLCDG